MAKDFDMISSYFLLIMENSPADEEGDFDYIWHLAILVLQKVKNEMKFENVYILQF